MAATTKIDLHPRDPFGRPVATLRPIRSAQLCEDADEDSECAEPAAFLLDAPGRLTIPLYLCTLHADAERTYHGAVVQR